MTVSHLKPFSDWLPRALQLFTKALKAFCGLAPVYLPSVFILYYYMSFELRFSLLCLSVDQFFDGLFPTFQTFCCICALCYCTYYTFVVHVYLII